MKHQQPGAVHFDEFPLKGGLDLHTPQIDLKQGVARDALNYECSINGGYSRIGGYERFSGKPSPTAAIYTTVAASAVAGIAVGDTVNGQTSGATGVVAYIDGLTVVMAKGTGTFVVAENLRKVVTVIGTISTVGVATTDQVQIATWQLAASNIVRADIAAVPGSGPVRGLFVFNNVVFAMRDNVSPTAKTLYKATGSGWTAIVLPYEVSFTTGSGTAPVAGATITKGAVSAVLRVVVIESGAFSTNDAAGRFICDAPTGGSFTAGAMTGGVTANLTAGLTGGLVQAAIVLAPGGRLETVTGNAGNGTRIYGADGQNRGFEFDGLYLVPIRSGQTVDTPLHVAVHKRYLFLSFASSAQKSAAGFPYQWTAVTGAAEFGVSQPITGFRVLLSSATSPALAIMSDRGISILYGSVTADFNLAELNNGVGCNAYASQSLNDVYVYDDIGITSLSATQQFGNFSSASLTVNLRSFVQARRTLVTESIMSRAKNQYRVFYSDGYGLYCTIVNGRFIGAMPVQFPTPVNVATLGASVVGAEVSYFGGTDGFVYQLDIGTSFDGAVIPHNIDLAFASQGSTRIRKRYRKAVFEVQGDGYAEFNVGYTLAYGDEIVVSSTLAAKVTPAYWDQFTWDEFIWDGRAIAPAYVSLSGSAENIALRFEGSSALWPSFTINSVTLHYTPRRVMR